MQSYEVVIISYKNRELLSKVLSEVRKQTAQPQGITVVDNGGDLSPDDPLLADGVLLVSRPDNPGYGAAVNEMRDRVRADNLLVLTHDVELTDNCVEELLKTASRHVLAAPVLYLSSDKSTIYSAGGKLGRGGKVKHMKQLPIAQDESYSVDWADGATLLIPIAIADQIGWFDEDYFLYFEEVDFCTRARERANQVKICPAAIAYQEPGNFTSYLQVRNTLLFSKKNHQNIFLSSFTVGFLLCKATIKSILRMEPAYIRGSIKGIYDYRRRTFGKPDAQ